MARTLLTGQEVISALTTKLRDAFTTTEITNVYKNKPLQLVNPPYIVVSAIQSIEEKELKSRGEKSYIIDIRVHPSKNADVYTWAITVSEKIIDAVSYITIDTMTVKSQSIEYNVTDDVLHVIVNYSFKIRYVEPDVPEMEELIQTEGVK